MNHLGDTNKMVETPRTDGLLTEILDAYGYVHQGNCPQRWVNHARELERELNAANERIKRLEDAGDVMEKYCTDYYSINRWYKAKEAKL